MKRLRKLACMVLVLTILCGPALAGLRGPRELAPDQARDACLSLPLVEAVPAGAAQSMAWQPRTAWVSCPAGWLHAASVWAAQAGADASAANRDDSSLTLLRLCCQLTI